MNIQRNLIRSSTEIPSTHLTNQWRMIFEKGDSRSPFHYCWARVVSDNLPLCIDNHPPENHTKAKVKPSMAPISTHIKGIIYAIKLHTPRLVSSSRLRKPFSRVPAVSAKKNRIKGFPCGPRLFSLFRSLSLEIVFPGVYIYLMLYNVGGCDCTKAKWTAFLFSSGPEWSGVCGVGEDDGLKWVNTYSSETKGKKGGWRKLCGMGVDVTWDSHTHHTHRLN